MTKCKCFTVAAIAFLFIAGCAKETTPTKTMFVESIPSADTLIVEGQGKQQRVRLCGVEVPKAQMQQAKKLLQTLVDPAEGWVVVWPMKMTNKGELIAEVYAPVPGKRDEEKSLNGELLAMGLAKVSAEKCSNREAFESAEQDAKERRVGIWKMR